MTSRSKSNKVISNHKGTSCYNISNIIEWFIIVIFVFLAALTEIPLFKSHKGYVDVDNTLYSYPYIPSSISNIKLLAITLGPTYFVFMFSVLVLKVTTYWQYHKELSVLRCIEIQKNKHNEPNKLKVLNNLLNNKYCSKEIVSHFISLTKAVLFALSLSHLITFCFQIYITEPSPFFNNSLQHSFDSFPSKSASNSMSTNCLLFLCMMHSFRSIQSKYFSHKYNGNILPFVSINAHCFNGNAYFCSNIWYLLRHVKIVAVFIVTTPLIITVYIGLIQIIEYTHFILDIMAGFSIGIFCALLSFNTFFDELLYETVIPTLSEVMHTQSEEQRSPSSSITSSIVAIVSPRITAMKNLLKQRKKSKFPDIGIDIDDDEYTNAFGSNVNDYNLRDLEEIALQIGTNRCTSTKTSRSIETDDDGVDVVDDDMDEETESEETEETTETSSISPSSKDESRISTVTAVSKRKHNLLYNHRKSIKLRLAPPMSSGSTKISQLSPLSMDYDKHQSNITAEPYFGNVQSVATTISPLSGAPSIQSYYME